MPYGNCRISGLHSREGGELGQILNCPDVIKAALNLIGQKLGHGKQVYPIPKYHKLKINLRRFEKKIIVLTINLSIFSRFASSILPSDFQVPEFSQLSIQ